MYTVEEMIPDVQHLKEARSKNLVLKDKKKKGYWLVLVLYRQINLHDLARQLGVGSGNLLFASGTAMLGTLTVGQDWAIPWPSSVVVGA